MSACPLPLGPSGDMGPVGPSEAGWVRLLDCGLPLGPDEFPRPWACGQARPGQGGCLPDIFSLWIHQRRQLGNLGAPTCLLAQKVSATRGPRSPNAKAQPLSPSLARLLDPLVWWERT